MAAIVMDPPRLMRALTDDVYETPWEVPPLSSAAFSSTKGSLINTNHTAPRIVVTTPKAPAWMVSTVSALSRTLNLPDNWDSYGGKKTQKVVVIRALTLLGQVMSVNSPAPSVVPLSDGGIQFEWHRKNQDLEITLSANEVPTFYYQHLGRGQEKEGQATEINLLASLVESIS
jgi:hypothetical protein